MLKQSLSILADFFLYIYIQIRSDSRLTGDSNAPKDVLFESRMQKLSRFEVFFDTKGRSNGHSNHTDHMVNVSSLLFFL